MSDLILVKEIEELEVELRASRKREEVLLQALSVVAEKAAIDLGLDGSMRGYWIHVVGWRRQSII